MCGGSECRILLLLILETIYVCIWCMFVVVTVAVCWNVCCVVVIVK